MLDPRLSPRSAARVRSSALLGAAITRAPSPLRCLRLLDHYGAAELEAGIGEALARGVPHPHTVRLALERRREQRDQPPPLPIALPADKRVRDLVVSPHKLDDYDQLQSPRDDDDDNHDEG